MIYMYYPRRRLLRQSGDRARIQIEGERRESPPPCKTSTVPAMIYMYYHRRPLRQTGDPARIYIEGEERGTPTPCETTPPVATA